MGEIFMSDNAITFEFPKITKELITPISIGSVETVQPIITVMAIWDTGSNKSSICPEIAKKLDLKPIRIVNFNNLSGVPAKCNVYMARIYFPNKFIVNIEVAESNPIGCDMIIGMDIISKGDIAITNFNGKTVLTFRIPSIEALDFTGLRNNNEAK